GRAARPPASHPPAGDGPLRSRASRGPGGTARSPRAPGAGTVRLPPRVACAGKGCQGGAAGAGRADPAARPAVAPRSPRLDASPRPTTQAAKSARSIAYGGGYSGLIAATTPVVMAGT